MALSIQTNPIALNTQRNLGTSRNVLVTAIQRLSSGMRINSARDDAAGLAIAQRMYARANGFTVAARNTNDGISLTQTAESALGKISDMLQRARALAVQSVNATNSAADRKALQSEVGQLMSEVDRIAKTTSFNSQKLLEGSFSGAYFQVGPNAGDNITVGPLQNSKTIALGQVAYGKSTSAAIQASDITAYSRKIEAGELRIRVGNTAQTVDLGEIAAASSATERMGQVVVAINNQSGSTGVTAFLQNNANGTYQLQVQSSSDQTVLFEGFNLSRTGFGGEAWLGLRYPSTMGNPSLYDDLNHYGDYVPKLENIERLYDLSTFVAQWMPYSSSDTPNDPYGEIRGFAAGLLINSTSRITMDAGLAAFTTATKALVTHTAATGYTIVDTASNRAALSTALDHLRTAFDVAVWQEGESHRAPVYTALNSLMSAPAGGTLNVTGLNNALADSNLAATGVRDAISTAAATVTANSTADQLSDVRKTIVGLVDQVMSGGMGIQASETQTQKGLQQLSVATQGDAWEAILRLDSALDQVSTARGNLGALQSRFQNTVENIGIQNENVTTARGRIMDADFAQETMQFSRAKIVQQAGMAMMAQANQLQKNVLVLLK